MPGVDEIPPLEENAGMDEPSPPAGDRGRPGGGSRDWLWKVVVPIVVAVVGAVLVAALTPVGSALSELLFPTRAAVSGSVLVDGQPAAGADLTLDGKDAGNADAGGAFLLVGVRSGTHRLEVQAVGAQPRDVEFDVQRGTTELKVGVVKLKPLLQLGYVASLDPRQFTGRPDQSIDYDLTLWIVGDPEVVNRVQSVAYTLPAPLPSAPVTGRSAQRLFCYRQAGALSFQDFFVIGGAFATATAVVDLGDGRPFQLSAQPGSSRPPACPVRRAAQVRPPSPAPVPVPVPVPIPAPTPSPTPAPVPTPGPTTSTAPAPTVTVPDVVGVSETSAKEKLAAAGFDVQVETMTDPTAKPGTVLTQSPEGGGKAPEGSTVTIVVAQGG